MSVKIGVAPGLWNWTDGGSSFFHFVEECERLGWDSLWLTDRLVSEHRVLEPVTAMAAIAARTQTLKFGASVLIPSLRNPAVLAKELATVDFLAGGRLLPAVGLGSEDPRYLPNSIVGEGLDIGVFTQPGPTGDIWEMRFAAFRCVEYQ